MSVEDLRYGVLVALCLMAVSWGGQVVMERGQTHKERMQAGLISGISLGLGGMMIILTIGCGIWFSP